MDSELMTYLKNVRDYLKPLSENDREDIVKEIESEMYELQTQEQLTSAQVIERLGSPKELTKSYLGDVIIQKSHNGIKTVCAYIAFWSLAGLKAMIVLPFTGILSFALYICAFATPIFGAIKLIASFFGIDVPIVVVQIGSYVAPPFAGFLLSIGFGVGFFLLSKKLWKVTCTYINKLSEQANRVKKKHLYIE